MTESADRDTESVASAVPERELTQEESALEAIEAIASGANPTQEAFRLSNEFTDRQTARFWAWLRRLKSRS
ncbi:MAG: hypothetical protein QOD05_1957 [Microbacteriaceae bacterium]|jgi:hypothetical protein|nr:hypothetical protein [Microbacteriaceae bacterium]